MRAILFLKQLARKILRDLQFFIGLPLLKRAKQMIFLGAFLNRKSAYWRLSGEDDSATASLKRDGHCSLTVDQDLLRELIDTSRAKLNQEVGGPNFKVSRKQQVNLLNRYDIDLTPENVFVRFALQPAILLPVAKYLGVAPRLEYIRLAYSLPHETEPAHSELWHVDRGDSRNVKVFVYINDVEQENGPFTFIDAGDSERVSQKFRFKGRVLDEEMESIVPRNRWIQFLGPSGSIRLVDTDRCYHFGSRSKEPRLLYMAWFSTAFLYTASEKRMYKRAKGVDLSGLGYDHLQQLGLR